ncbi:MAG TPA: LacI family DNA-binding transcriptional regulator [Chitinophagaceae bacterium]|nr:LacI family DNA-binding transcriptional regulator [Chitinophagaceae bacterium]
MIQKPATIKEIAKRLNVSVSTVSRALHNHPSIGLRTKMQVQKLAKELNYEPNQAAISFKQGKTFTIGVILPNLGEEFFSTAINGIEDIAIQNNYTVLIGQSHDDVEREKKIVDTMRRHRVDGLLVSLSKNTISYEHFEQLANYSIPVVFFDRVPDIPDAYSVSCNLKNSSIQLVDWLVSRGHKYIGFIKGPDTMLPSQERLNGFLEGLKKNKLSMDPAYIVQTDLDKEKTFAAMKQLLSLKKKPTAIIAFNDYVALDAIKYSRSQGLKVNKDIYFVSYANLPMTSYLDEPPLASVEQFPYEQAEKATEILIRLINKDTGIGDKKLLMQSKVIVHQELNNKDPKDAKNGRRKI